MQTGNKREKRKEIKIPKIKKEELLTLEDCISALILIILQHCSYNSIYKGSLIDFERISKNTIKSNLTQGKISPESFEPYIKAFGEIKQFNFETDNKWDCADIEKEKVLLTECYNILVATNEIYKKLKDIPHDSFSEKISDWDSVGNLSQRFWYLLNKCFEAFCTLEDKDLLFLIIFFRSDETARQLVLAKMNEAKANNHSYIVNDLLNKTGKLWIDAHEKYSSQGRRQSSSKLNWEIFIQQIQKLMVIRGGEAGTIQQIRKIRIVKGFLQLIWPKEGEIDTKFGSQEIEALIVFKYFLTEEAQQNLLDELQGDYA